MFKEDGGRQNAWSFGTQIKVDNKKVADVDGDRDQNLTADETGAEQGPSEENADETIEERVKRILKDKGIDM